MTGKLITPNPKEDVGTPSALIGTAYRCDTHINVFDLCLSSDLTGIGGLGYQTIDYSDLIAEGSYIESVLIEATLSSDDAILKETYLVVPSVFNNTKPMYLGTIGQQDNGDRTAYWKTDEYFSCLILQSSGELTEIFKSVAPPNAVVALIDFTSTLNLKNGNLYGHDNIKITLSGSVPELMKKVVFKVIGFTTKLYFKGFTTKLYFKEAEIVKAIKSVWLIEAPGSYYLSVVDHTQYGDFKWITDIKKALQFTSEEQAKNAMVAIRKCAGHHFNFTGNLREPICKEYSLSDIGE